MSTAVLEQLNRALDAVAAVDVDGLAGGELDAWVLGLQRAKHRPAGAAAWPLARWDATSVWRSDGSRSAATRLARDGLMSMRTAHVELRRARKLRDMPTTAEAVTAGRVSMDHVDLLGRADQAHRHDLFERDEALLVEQCSTLRYAQAVKAVEYWTQRADAETDTPPEPERPSRLHASITLDRTVRVDGLLGRIDGAIVTGELSRLEREQYLADQAAGITRTRSASTPRTSRITTAPSMARGRLVMPPTRACRDINVGGAMPNPPPPANIPTAVTPTVPTR